MPRPQKVCKVCGKKATPKVHISTNAKCAECAMRGLVLNARASIQAGAAAAGKGKQRTGVRM